MLWTFVSNRGIFRRISNKTHFFHIVTRRLNSRWRPKYAQATIERVFEEVIPIWSAPCPVLCNGPINTHSDNRRGVFYVVSATPSAGKGPMNMQSHTWRIFSAWSVPVLYNETLFVARSRLENWNWEFRRIKRMTIKRSTTETTGMRTESFVGWRSHGKLVVDEELGVSLWRFSAWLEDLVTVKLF
jgi:hypothetical protein